MTETPIEVLDDAIMVLERTTDNYADRMKARKDVRRHLREAGLEPDAWGSEQNHDLFKYGRPAEAFMDEWADRIKWSDRGTDPEEYREALMDFAREQ